MKPWHLSVSLLLLSFTILFNGCTAAPAPAEEVLYDNTLPHPQINGHLSDTEAIAFEWKAIADTRVKGFRIYRDDPSSEDKNLYRIATVDTPLSTHFVDTDLAPATVYRYRFTTFDAAGHESVAERTYAAKTLAPPEPVSFFTATKELARSAKLLWRPHPDLRVTGYVIERNNPGSARFRPIASVDGRLHAEFIDNGLDDNSTYRYRIITRAFDGKRSAPSPIVTVSTKPLPPAPTGVTARSNLVRSVELQWNAVTRQGLSHYNIYRSAAEDGRYEYRAKVLATRFKDRIDEDSKQYFYAVTAIDKDGLESPRSAVVSAQTMPPPATPVLLGVNASGNAIVVHWESKDPRTTSYTLIKTTRSGWFASKTARFEGLKTTTFTDPNVVGGREYSYAIVAVDAHGLVSAPSKSKTAMLEAP